VPAQTLGVPLPVSRVPSATSSSSGDRIRIRRVLLATACGSCSGASRSRKQHQSCTRRLRRGLKASDAAPATPSPAQDELLLPLQRLPGENAASYTLTKKC